jgi:hypothetical protein
MPITVESDALADAGALGQAALGGFIAAAPCRHDQPRQLG